MSKQMITIGYQIPGFSDAQVSFADDQSLMDADIVVISPEGVLPRDYGWVSFDSGGGCYDLAESKEFSAQIAHLSKEISDFLASGGTVFIILSKLKKYILSSGTSSPRKGERTYHTYEVTNYDFLPVNVGRKISASGKHVEYLGGDLFRDFYGAVGSNLEHKLYLEGGKYSNIFFTGKNKDRVLGAHIKCGPGNLVLLPYIAYDFDDFTEEISEGGGEKRVWTKKALAFGKKLAGTLQKIDKSLSSGGEMEALPEWTEKEAYILESEKEISAKIAAIQKEKEGLEKSIKEQEGLLYDERVLKGLLFGQGKQLELAVIRALRILGYSAEGYDDGTLELDQVIVSPEGFRYIGECEGKDTKDINITKFRQLVESMNADFDREEVEEKAFGLLFGNPQRHTDPSERDSDFTAKCKIGAEREKIGLIKTVDLFYAARHALESEDEGFKKACRDAIHNGLGSVTVFPTPSQDDSKA